MLRIAVDTRPLDHPTTGIGRYTHNILKTLEGRGHEIISCTTSGSRGKQTVVSQLRYATVARHASADLFWSPRHHLPLLLNDLPAVVTIHDLVWKKVPDTMPHARRWAERFLMRSALHRADQIIAVSESTRADILEACPKLIDRVHVIAEAPTLGPSETKAAQQESPAPPYMLFVGTLEPRKNLARVIDAFKRANLPAYQLIIAGQPGWGDVSIPEGPSIKWIRPTSDVELATLYANAEFLVAPSLYEGFGLQVAEALAFGKAVITSNGSSLPEVAGAAGLLVDPKNTNEIRNAMQNLANDKSLREGLERNAQKHVRRFSWQKATDQTLDVFRLAIEKKSKIEQPRA